MLIEMGGKYQYRNGQPARVLCTDSGHHIYPVIATGANGSITSHTPNGTYLNSVGTSASDLIPVPSPPRYEPFTDADRDKVRGKWLTNKTDGSQMCVTNFSNSQAAGRSWLNLLNFYTFMDDGSPVGKLVTTTDELIARAGVGG